MNHGGEGGGEVGGRRWEEEEGRWGTRGRRWGGGSGGTGEGYSMKHGAFPWGEFHFVTA